MQILKFRIKNFRSIIDTNWRSFSPDGVTVLVGQNESGKSAILEALSTTFSNRHITIDDIRYGCELPEVSFKIKFTTAELLASLQGQADPLDIGLIKNHFENVKESAELVFSWSPNEPPSTKLLFDIYINDDNLEIPATAYINAEGETTATEEDTLSSLAGRAVYKLAPVYTLFQSNSGLLPNTINVDSDFKLSGDGATAANNLLSILDIELEEFVKLDERSRESKTARATDTLNRDFKEFWNQKIGLENKIKIEFALQHHSNLKPEFAGRPYLIFWVSDGLHKLHPKQRSAGVRWFISFYLQLKASQKLNKKIHFLLDEPGANLHSNAQHDVLKLINILSKELQITYSTHSPTLIEHEKLYRVYAIQRNNDHLETPTEIIDAHQLGAASSDTLSPILSAIGTDLSHQNVIQKKNNIILEETSGFYYLTSFLELLDYPKKPQFIAATGANKIPALANMFTGWGLNFSVVIDDDNQGRSVYNQLKKDLFGDIEAEANKKIYKMKGCNGIEDIFSPHDFHKFVINEAFIENKNSPSEIVKSSKYSKPVLAYNFYLKIKNKEVTKADFENETIEKIQETLDKIASIMH